METEFKYLISPDVAELSYRLECAVRNLGAVREAMESGSWEMEYYTSAVFTSYLFLSELARELQEMVKNIQAVNMLVTEETAE